MNNPRQQQAIQESLNRLQDANLKLISWLRINEPANELELKAALDVARRVFGAKIEPHLMASLNPAPILQMPMQQQLPSNIQQPMIGQQQSHVKNMQAASSQQTQ
jgi:hypothetical protein